MAKSCSIEDLLSALTEDLSAQDVLAADITSSIANAITKRRMALNMNQKEMAELFDRSQSTISKWENGDLNYSIDLLADIAVKLGMELSVKMTPPLQIQSDKGYRTLKSQTVLDFRCIAASRDAAKYERELSLKEM